VLHPLPRRRGRPAPQGLSVRQDHRESRGQRDRKASLGRWEDKDRLELWGRPVQWARPDQQEFQGQWEHKDRLELWG
jgi:hypothetical protein